MRRTSLPSKIDVQQFNYDGYVIHNHNITNLKSNFGWKFIDQNFQSQSNYLQHLVKK